MTHQASNGKHSNLEIHFLTEFKRACESSHILDDATVWPFREFMYGPGLAVIKAWLTLISKDANRQEVSIKIYARVANHSLRSYATDAVIAKRTRKFTTLNKIP